MIVRLISTILSIMIVISKCDLICQPSTKKVLDNGVESCIQITNQDVISSIHWLAHPPKTSVCKYIKTDGGITYCADNLVQNKCTVWTVVATNRCNDLKSMEFEKILSHTCKVHIFHYYTIYKGNNCDLIPSGKVEEYPNLNITRHDIWSGRCFGCFYKHIIKNLSPINYSIDILVVQRLQKDDIFDGIQYTIFSDFFNYLPSLKKSVKQIVMTSSINSNTLTDGPGREAEHAWNMWATRQFLSNYASISTIPVAGPSHQQPRQFEHILKPAKVDMTYAFYQHSFIDVSPAEVTRNELLYSSWRPDPFPVLKGAHPTYCKIPEAEYDRLNNEMQNWIRKELNVRCHPTRLAVICIESRQYDPIVPCQQELMDKLAEDYAVTKGWCDFKQPGAAIPMIGNVDPEALHAFKKPYFAPDSHKVRLAFLFTIYSDAKHVKRLLARLFSPDHYYLLHIDPAGSKPEFEEELLSEIDMKYKQYKNIYIAKSIPIVYGASTATMLLTQTMAWFHREASGWNYFVPITGSDYPLVPLKRLEHMLAYQAYNLSSPMPFVMGWTPGTSTHIFRLSRTYPEQFLYDKEVDDSIQAVMLERGRPLGSNPMEYRASNFGPPVFCANQQSFYHLDNRRNKSAVRMDTMWLFPRDDYRGKGRAYASEDRTHALPSFDGRFRVWLKSDPATTGIYDSETVKYIVESEEGRKYYHFFKHMLLGSEEHYYISLLYNWNRTWSAVMKLTAEVVWNTWELGIWEQSPGFQTHTHFLSFKELDIIKGFAKRGMVFARKFSSLKTSELLDFIDTYIHFNSSTDAGTKWPGYFEVDTESSGKIWKESLKQKGSLLQPKHRIKKKPKHFRLSIA